MNKIKISLLFLFLVSFIAIAQQKKFVSYTVKNGETIKSIAKDFDISTRELLNLNPDVDRKPDANTIIIVPNKNFRKAETEVESVKEEPSIIQKDSDDFIDYTVVKDDTVYSLIRRFNVSEEELIASNPVFNEGLKKGIPLKDLLKLGMHLNFPNKNKTTNSFKHTVVKDDTVYNITKRFGISVEELYKLNPNLSTGLKLGMVLTIKQPEKTPNLEDIKIVNKRENYLDKKGMFVENINYNKEIQVVLMLPYQLNKLTDSIKNGDFKKSNSLLNIVTEFHLGAEMAIDSLKQKGLRVQVKYLDTEDTNYRLQHLINNTNFNATDVVIGPLFFENAHWVSKQIKVPVIAPIFSKKQTEFSDNNLVISSPNTVLLEDALLAYLKKSYKGENIIVINDEKPESQSKLWRIVTRLKAFDSVKKIEVIKPEKGFINNKKILEMLKQNSKNWVIMISDDNVTTASAINSLKGVDEKFNITLFALSKGNNFDTVDNNFLAKLNFVYPISEFLNIDDETIKSFFEKYYSKNNAVPSKYAIRGFDVTYDALIRIASNNDFEEALNDGKSLRISSVFSYHKTAFGGFENKGVFLIQYSKDLTPIILNH